MIRVYLRIIRKMSANMQVVAVDVVSIKKTTKELKDSMENIRVRLGEVELWRT